ncbi:MAG: malic enzyme-like NAD(P)-binding protein, partial [Pseudoalteromonas spongiae]
TDEMLMVASETLAAESPRANTGEGSLLPPLTKVESLSKKIAFNVAKKAIEQGVALEISDEKLASLIEKNYWLPEYRDYKRVSI